MPADAMGWAKFVWDLVPDKRKIMLAFVVAGLLSIFLPWKYLEAMNVNPWVGTHRGIEWMVVGICGLILLFQGIETGWKHFSEGRRIDKRLCRLTAEELRIIERLIAGDQIICWPYQRDVIFLVKDGILWELDCKFDNNQKAYGITNVARERIVKMGIGEVPKTPVRQS